MNGIEAEKPDISGFFKKSVNLKLSSFFSNIASATINGYVGNIPLTLKDITNVFKDIKIVNNEGLAWVLIYKALSSSLYEIIKENYQDLCKENSTDANLAIQRFFIDVDSILDENSIILEYNFLENPLKLEFLEKIKDPFFKLFTENKFTNNEINSIYKRFPSYFILSLAKEYSDNNDKYTPLKDALKNPFSQVAQKELDWIKYSYSLKKEINKKMFNESFSLEQIYIPPTAYFKFKKNIDNQADPEIQNLVVNLETELESWLDNNDSNDSLRIISGSPGSGKSSFCKIFSAKQSEFRKVLFIPLYVFDVTDDLNKAIDTFLKNDPYLNNNPLLELKNDSRPLLIVFDGLDELSKQGKFAEEVSENFLEKIKTTLGIYNRVEKKLQIIISGREIIVQKNQNKFHNIEQILNILPYFNKPNSYFIKNEIKFSDENSLLSVDQRDIWWKKYGELKGKNYSELPKELKNENLDELTTQPLLNYLLALVWENNEKIDFSNSTLNLVYERLLEYIYERVWENKKQHSTLKDFTKEKFIRVLQEIALATWHGNNKTVSVSEIEKYFERSNIKKSHLDFLKEESEKSIFRLLTSFYFRENGRDNVGNPTFEFTHKSFSEYLVAIRILNFLKLMCQKIEEDGDDSWSCEKALEEWAKITGKTELDQYISLYIYNEIITKFKKEESEKFQNIICTLIEYLLKNGMPMHKISLKSFKEEYIQSINSEKALLVLLSICSKNTKKISIIKWGSDYEFGEWVIKLIGHKEYFSSISFNNINLIKLNLSCLNLMKLNFSGADLSGTNLSGTNLSMTDLSGANLSGANLLMADLSDADLSDADLSRANLSGSDISSADLSRANLSRAKLSRANLSRANLSDADLSRANLSRADLSRANLSRANLSRTDLSDADLSRADLSGSYLSMADLSNANLSGAYLLFANLSGSYLSRADLSNANLSGADLSDADLSRANLSRAILPQNFDIKNYLK